MHLKKFNRIFIVFRYSSFADACRWLQIYLSLMHTIMPIIHCTVVLISWVLIYSTLYCLTAWMLLPGQDFYKNNPSNLPLFGILISMYDLHLIKAIHTCIMLQKLWYHMAGNFCGVLIFIIFVVDLAVKKFSHPWKLMPTVICESVMMGVAINITAAWPTLPSISKQQ